MSKVLTIEDLSHHKVYAVRLLRASNAVFRDAKAYVYFEGYNPTFAEFFREGGRWKLGGYGLLTTGYAAGAWPEKEAALADLLEQRAAAGVYIGPHDEGWLKRYRDAHGQTVRDGGAAEGSPNTGVRGPGAA